MFSIWVFGFISIQRLKVHFYFFFMFNPYSFSFRGRDCSNVLFAFMHFWFIDLDEEVLISCLGLDGCLSSDPSDVI